MKNRILTAVILSLLSILPSAAHIDVVYPKQDNYKTSAASVFIIGNTTNGAEFTINSKNVKLWENNFFVEVVPLKHGRNKIKMVSKKNGEKEELVYTVTRTKNDSSKSDADKKYYPQKQGVLYAKTIKDYAPVRENPSDSADRIIDLSSGAGLYLAGRQGDFYKLDENGSFWIHKSNISEPVPVSKRPSAELKRIEKHSDKKYDYTEFSLSEPVFHTLQQSGGMLALTLYGVRKADGSDYTYIYRQLRPILGYETYYDGSRLVLKTAKPPKIKNVKRPLKDISIFIDPGHGGDEKGAIGPSRICEKDVNLAISRHLAEYLKEEGADVKISRRDDRKAGLYERADAAKKHNALISVSIHNNALSDGKDPYEQHGAEVHYYNENAEYLAGIIQEDLVQNLYFKDGGVHKSSFALTRSTNPVSVLVECAYMINPEEYIKLKNPDIQKEIARSIAGSIKKYVMSVQK